jgi:hypothetical protein
MIFIMQTLSKEKHLLTLKLAKEGTDSMENIYQSDGTENLENQIQKTYKGRFINVYL